MLVPTIAILAPVMLLFIAAPLMGTFNSIFQMTTHQTVGRYGGPEQRASNFATQSLGISAATFLGPMIAGLAIDHLGFANAFFVTALLGFAPMAVVWSGLLHLPPPREHKREERTPVSGWALLKDRELRRAYIAAASNNAIGFMLNLSSTSSASSAAPPSSSAAFTICTQVVASMPPNSAAMSAMMSFVSA